MKTVYFVRHGEAEVNLGTHFKGEDSPLTELGKEQARFIAERVKRLPFDLLVASTMVRARETAQAISSATGKSILLSDLFCERRIPSVLEGRSRADEDANRLYAEWTKSFVLDGVRAADGENFADICERAGKALIFLENRPEKNIVVAGHGFFTRMLIARMWYGESLSAEKFEPLEWGMRTKNTGISILKYDPEDMHRPWWLLVWNDHSHLG